MLSLQQLQWILNLWEHKPPVRCSILRAAMRKVQALWGVIVVAMWSSQCWQSSSSPRSWATPCTSNTPLSLITTYGDPSRLVNHIWRFSNILPETLPALIISILHEISKETLSLSHSIQEWKRLAPALPCQCRCSWWPGGKWQADTGAGGWWCVGCRESLCCQGWHTPLHLMPQQSFCIYGGKYSINFSSF